MQLIFRNVGIKIDVFKWSWSINLKHMQVSWCIKSVSYLKSFFKLLQMLSLDYFCEIYVFFLLGSNWLSFHAYITITPQTPNDSFIMISFCKKYT